MGKFKFHLVLFTVALIYGATFSIAKDVMPEYLRSYGFIALRVGFAAILFWIVHLIFIKEKVKGIKDYAELFVCGFFGVALNMSLFFKGLETSLPIHGAVLMLAAPVFVLIFQKMIYKVKITWLQWLGIFTALIGSFFLIAGNGLQFDDTTWFGDLLIVFNAISYAFYLVFVKRVLEKYHFVTVAKWSFAFAFILVLPLGYEQLMETNFVIIPTFVWGEILFVLFFTTFLTYFLNAYAIQNTSPSVVGSYIYLQPLLATSIAIILKKDFLTWEKVALALLIFAGVYMVNRKKL